MVNVDLSGLEITPYWLSVHFCGHTSSITGFKIVTQGFGGASEALRIFILSLQDCPILLHMLEQNLTVIVSYLVTLSHIHCAFHAIVSEIGLPNLETIKTGSKHHIL